MAEKKSPASLEDIIRTVLTNAQTGGGVRIEGNDPTQQSNLFAALLGMGSEGVTKLLSPNTAEAQGPLGTRLSFDPTGMGTGFAMGETVSLGPQAGADRQAHETGHAIQNRLNPIGNLLLSLSDSSLGPSGFKQNPSEQFAGAQFLGALIRRAERGDKGAIQMIESMDPATIEEFMFRTNEARVPTTLQSLLTPGAASFAAQNPTQPRAMPGDPRALASVLGLDTLPQPPSTPGPQMPQGLPTQAAPPLPFKIPEFDDSNAIINAILQFANNQ